MPIPNRTLRLPGACRRSDSQAADRLCFYCVCCRKSATTVPLRRRAAQLRTRDPSKRIAHAAYAMSHWISSYPLVAPCALQSDSRVALQAQRQLATAWHVSRRRTALSSADAQVKRKAAEFEKRASGATVNSAHIHVYTYDRSPSRMEAHSATWPAAIGWQSSA